MNPCVNLFGLPIPPTSNHQYRVAMIGRGKIRMVPTKDLLDFRKKMEQWSKSHALALNHAKEQVQEWVKEKNQLSIHTTFQLSYGRIFTKDGRVKKMDVSNRIKSLHDELCKLFEIDDSLFFFLSASKLLCSNETPIQESVKVVIEKCLVH